MGKIKRGILGGFSGKVANIIGGSWKGIAYIRSQPLSVANPRTAGQIAQRTAFAFAVVLAQAILATIIKPMWDRFAQQMSGYNAFIKANVGVLKDFENTVWSDIKMSLGKMIATTIDSVVVASGSAEVTVAWDNTLIGQLQLADDKVFITVVNETQQTAKGFISNKTRADSSAGILLPSVAVADDVIHFYLSFLRDDGSVVSDSSYMEKIVV